MLFEDFDAFEGLFEEGLLGEELLATDEITLRNQAFDLGFEVMGDGAQGGWSVLFELVA